VRRSTSEKDTMVLESIEKGVPEKMTKVAVRFKNSSVFLEIYQNIRRGVIELSEKKIEDLLHEDLK
jgi:hypothetical protein